MAMLFALFYPIFQQCDAESGWVIVPSRIINPTGIEKDFLIPKNNKNNLLLKLNYSLISVGLITRHNIIHRVKCRIVLIIASKDRNYAVVVKNLLWLLGLLHGSLPSANFRLACTRNRQRAITRVFGDG